MSKSLVLIALTLICCLGIARAQTDGQPGSSDAGVCSKDVSADEARQLEKQRAEYEQAIARADADAQASGEDCPAGTPAAECPKRRLQTRLLAVMERLECHRLQALPPENKGIGEVNFVALKILYATDRVKDHAQTVASRDPYKYFTGKLDEDFQDFSYGTAVVTIPTSHTPGELEMPAWWQFTNRHDPSRYFELQQITESTRKAILDDLNASGASADSSLLLFVHGFNVSFADALLHTAQLAHDMKFPGKVMAYSWPSGGRIIDYWRDEESAQLATPRFEKLLKDLLATKISRIYIIAHSMGTRIVIRGFSDLYKENVKTAKVSQIALAAADFNQLEFKSLAGTFAKLREQGTHTTIYAASNDFALQVSRVVHSYDRLGETSPTMAVFNRLDSIDASFAAPGHREYGHSYVVDSFQVIRDITAMLLKRTSPDRRGLEPVPGTSGNGWRIPPP